MEMLELTGNVGLALLLGPVIGLERQLRQHPAGLRTNALVSVGAALFVSLSSLLDDKNSPTRIAAYVVSEIGFLGGGVILKEGINVRGMNTAATLWCTAAVGTLVGSGFGLHAVVGVVHADSHFITNSTRRVGPAVGTTNTRGGSPGRSAADGTTTT